MESWLTGTAKETGARMHSQVGGFRLQVVCGYIICSSGAVTGCLVRKGTGCCLSL